MSLVPPNAMIIPIDTRSSIKVVILPDVATNPGRYIICKDVYGTAGVSSIFFSTLSGNFFEQTWSNTYIGSQAYGAWHLTNDAASRWLFTNLYTNDLSIFNQTNIVTRGLFFNLEGNTYDGTTYWGDSLSNINLSSGIAAAAPRLGFNEITQTTPSFATNRFFRSYNFIASTFITSSFTYSLWLSTATAGCVLNETQNPSTFVSSVGQAVCCIINTNSVRTGFRTRTGGNVVNASQFTPGRWINVTWSLNFSTLTTYINASTTAVITNNVTVIRSTFENSYLTVGLGSPGFNLGTTASYTGLIGSIRLYSTVLSLAEVRQNYNADAFRYGLNSLS